MGLRDGGVCAAVRTIRTLLIAGLIVTLLPSCVSAGEPATGPSTDRSASVASGRFAMVDDGLGFQLVPWTPSVEKHIGQHISGVARADGGVDWSFSRRRGLGL